MPSRLLDDDPSSLRPWRPLLLFAADGLFAEPPKFVLLCSRLCNDALNPMPPSRTPLEYESGGDAALVTYEG